MARGSISAEKRSATGKGAARRLRQAGKIPASVYGTTREAVSATVDVVPLQRVLQTYGTGRPIDLDLGDEKHVVLIREVQREPVRGDIQHVDFNVVALDVEVRALVPIVIIGEEQRENDGGVVTQSLREIEVSCLPTHIPELIEADVSGLEIGATVTLEDLAMPEGVTHQLEPEEVVVSVILPREEEVEEDVDELDEELLEDEDETAAEEESEDAEE